MRVERESEDRLDSQAQRYEERLTELHSVIAELSRKIDQQRINVIAEEEAAVPEDYSQSELSHDQHDATGGPSLGVIVCFVSRIKLLCVGAMGLCDF